MAGSLYKLVLLLVVIAVLAVFVVPSVDLPETALRASQIAGQTMPRLTLLAIPFLLQVVRLWHMVEKQSVLPAPTPRLHPLLCTFLL